MIRKYIDKIGENKKPEDMQKLGDMLSDLIELTEESHPDLYRKYKNKLKGMAYNYKFDEDMAHEIVEHMKPLGEYWDLNTIKQVKEKYQLECDANDLYVVMNSLVNDYGNIISAEDVDTYVGLAKAFINDEDAVEHKVWKYFTKIPKNI